MSCFCYKTYILAGTRRLCKGYTKCIISIENQTALTETFLSPFHFVLFIYKVDITRICPQCNIYDLADWLWRCADASHLCYHWNSASSRRLPKKQEEIHRKIAIERTVNVISQSQCIHLFFKIKPKTNKMLFFSCFQKVNDKMDSDSFSQFHDFVLQKTGGKKQITSVSSNFDIYLFLCFSVKVRGSL